MGPERVLMECVRVCARGSRVVMEQSRPDRDVTQQRYPVPHPPLLVHTHTHRNSHTHSTVTYTQTAWLSMSSFGSCLTWEKRIYFVYSTERTVDHSSHTGNAAHCARQPQSHYTAVSGGMKLSIFTQVLSLSTFWITRVLLDYFHFMLLYTSTPPHFKGKYCTFYHITFIWQLQLLCRLRLYAYD